MKYLAIDYGSKYTGIAVSDPRGVLAFPRKTLVMTTKQIFYTELVDIITLEAPDALVVGLPLLFDGSETLTTRKVYNFIKRLLYRVTLPVFLMEEVLSTYAAEKSLREVGYTSYDMENIIDQQAAVCILQSFLDQPEKDRSVFVA